MRKIEAVLFDLDGVLTDTAKYHFEAWKKIANELHISFDLAYNEKLKGVSRRESLDLLLDNGPGRDAFSEEQKEQLAAKKNDDYVALISRLTPADTLPGIRTFLEELKQRNIKMAVASVSRNAGFILSRLQIESFFAYVADARLVRRLKPYPDIFLDCAKHLDTEPQYCVGIEDARVGIQAIHAAGMKAVGVGNRLQMEDADIILDGTQQLCWDVIS